MATAEDFECWFHQSVLDAASEPVKEPVMNKYTITAREVRIANFHEVEAESEEDAIQMVEWGNVEADDYEFDELTDIDVTDVEYGEVKYVAELTLSVHSRGVKDDDVRDLLWDLLARIDGSTESGTEGEIEVVGFNIVSLNER